ncbi:MAG: hypothetical protein NTW94_09505 [Legionellales bacterium]|nr:hypothetical protein [Legionellales bacterium]
MINKSPIKVETMHKRTFISRIEEAIYIDIEEINTDQMDLSCRILSEFDDIILEATEITEHQYHNILDLVKTLLIYDACCSKEKWVEFSNKTNSILFHPQPLFTPTIPADSLLAAMYYINDIIAGSSAMGRGLEVSIIPSAKHCDSLVTLLRSIYTTPEPSEAASFIISCRHVKKSEAYRRLVPLLFDIAETTYAGLLAWKIENIRAKQAEVDRFYIETAESCMAKGSLNILKLLQNLPDDFLHTLSGIRLDETVAKNLNDCSKESQLEIQSSYASRRYRSGNSGSVWLEIRKRATIEWAPKHEPMLEPETSPSKRV